MTGADAVSEPRSDRSAIAEFYEVHGEKVRYLLVGACNTFFSYVIFLGMLMTVGRWAGTLASSPVVALSFVGHKSYIVAEWAAWVLAVVVSTTTFKYFVFYGEGHLLGQIGRGYLVYLPAEVISTVILWLTVQVAHLSPQVGKLVTIVFATVFSYLGHKYFTFRVPLEVGEAPPEMFE